MSANRHDDLDSKKPLITLEVPQNKPQIKPEIGMPVFAKWVDKTLILYWPGKIKDIREEKFLIEYEDGVEKLLKRDDFIIADGMVRFIFIDDVSI